MTFNVVAYLKQTLNQVLTGQPTQPVRPSPTQPINKPSSRPVVDPAEQCLVSHIDDMCDCVDA